MDWGSGRWREANPILGDTPTVGTIAIYNAVVIAGLVVGKLTLPEWAQSALYATTIAVQVDAIMTTAARVPGVCGLSGSAVSK